jgi:Zn-dependent peptidase ImmA (M78 family)
MTKIEKALSDLADKTLKESGMSTIPVPVTKIAEFYGFSVFEGLLNEGESGLILVSDTKIEKYNSNKIIMINHEEAEVRKRFTIAHELGHYILNDKPTQCYAHRETGKSDFEEIMANSFASYLLMPEKYLKKYVAHLRDEWFDKIPDDFLIYSVSRQFMVSKDAARVRLTKMGEI